MFLLTLSLSDSSLNDYFARSWILTYNNGVKIDFNVDCGLD